MCALTERKTEDENFYPPQPRLCLKKEKGGRQGGVSVLEKRNLRSMFTMQ